MPRRERTPVCLDSVFNVRVQKPIVVQWDMTISEGRQPPFVDIRRDKAGHFDLPLDAYVDVYFGTVYDYSRR